MARSLALVSLGVMLGLADPVTAIERPIAGSKLLIKDSADIARRKLVFLSKDGNAIVTSRNPGIDPSVGGARLSILTYAGGITYTTSISLDAASWDVSKDSIFKYDDGRCKVRVKHQKKIKILCKGSVLEFLSVPVGAQDYNLFLYVGNEPDEYCANFGGQFERIDPGKRFLSKFAPRGVCKKLVFVSSAFVQGNFGGVAAADQMCNVRAATAGLAGTYRAWLSESSPTTSPAIRFTAFAGPYELVDGTWLAPSASWFFGVPSTLLNSINRNEFGNAVGTEYQPAAVWTGTELGGWPSGSNCSNWTSTSGEGTIGLDWDKWLWSDCEASLCLDERFCARYHPIYCFQQ